jgi:NAD(P)-dependent dehydrogenase (short-subunit alcohol dehydrogenase family)
MQELSGKVAFVTGGTTGIGLGIAKALAGMGMRIVVTYRREEARRSALTYFAEYPDVEVHAIQVDVTDRGAVAAAAQETLDRFGKVHVLCNSAAVTLMGDMDAATYEDWDWVFDVNVKGVINTLVAFMPLIKAHGEGGHILNVASMGAFIAGPNAGVYCASKFAVRGISEGLRFNLAPFRIGVSLVCPGLTRTEIYRTPLNRPAHLTKTGTQLDPSFLERLANVHATGMDPDEVGRRVLQGLLRNDFYIFTHPEFRREIEEICGELLAEFPAAPAGDAPRLVYEELRRSRKAEARRFVQDLRDEALRALGPEVRSCERTIG